MKKLHIFIVSLVCSFSALCQNINFYDYCQLHKKGTKIREKQIKLDPRSISKEAILYYFAADYLGIDSSANSYYKASILPKMDIYHLINVDLQIV